VNQYEGLKIQPFFYSETKSLIMSEFSKLIQGPTPVLVDFFATWCGPCKMMSPILEQVKNKVGDQVKIVKVDVDKNPAIAQQLKVRGVPTLVLFRQGSLLWRQSGVVSEQQLLQILETHVAVV
jgi:thioredoxin 1